MKIKGDVIVRINAGCDDGLHRSFFGYLLDAWDGAAQTDGSEIHHALDPVSGEFIEPCSGVVDAFLLIPPRLGVIVHDFRRKDEDVLVHERDAELG